MLLVIKKITVISPGIHSHCRIKLRPPTLHGKLFYVQAVIHHERDTLKLVHSIFGGILSRYQSITAFYVINRAKIMSTDTTQATINSSHDFPLKTTLVLMEILFIGLNLFVNSIN